VSSNKKISAPMTGTNKTKKPNFAYLLLAVLTIIVAGAKLMKGYKNDRHATLPSVEVNQSEKSRSNTSTNTDVNQNNNNVKDKDYLPSASGEVVSHTYYTLSYVEKYEQAEWVCYTLTKEKLQLPNVPRSDWFNPDPSVSTQSVNHFDYKGSGYTRGHLVPAGDMSFDEKAMEETFYMSNMSPQLRGFNNGVWRELEEQSRDWTYQNKSVIVVSGPIISDNPKYFKKKHVAIPESFYKIIFDISMPETKAIAFVIPHEVSTKPLADYAVTIDKVEEITGIDFFEKYNLPMLEKIESSIDLSKWPISQARYKLRVERWNYE
jgi:endonuclease G, mitochondrial